MLNEEKAGRNELLFLLTSLYNYALKCIFQKFEAHIKQPEVFNLFKTAEEIFTVYQQIIKNKKECEEVYRRRKQRFFKGLTINPYFHGVNAQ